MATSGKDAFTRALERFKGDLTDEQKTLFTCNSFKEVEDYIQKIEDQYGPQKKLRNMRRLSKFLGGMKQVEELVTIFLNVSEAVAFVWGPIKFGLMIARNRLETLEALLDMYVEVGEVIPGLRQYEQAFDKYPHLKDVLERCFQDILEFHKEALSFLERPSWRKQIDYACNTFNTRCKPIIESLRRHQTLLGHEKLTTAIVEVQEGRREAQDFRRVVEEEFRELSEKLEAENEKRSKKEAEESQKALQQTRRTISSQLRPGNYLADQQSALSQFFSSPLGDWVLQEGGFNEWLHSSNGRVLYLHGMPGAGKTTLTSRIIQFLQSQKDTLKGPVLFFYFKSREDDKRSMDGMLRALLHQLIHADDWTADYVRQTWESISELEFNSLPTLQGLLRDCLVLPRGGTIVLDGLDECQHEGNTSEEPEKIIEWIHEDLLSKARLKGCPVRVLVSSQHVDFLEEELTKHPSIRLDQATGHLSNIRAFADFKVIQMQKKFPLTSSRREEIVRKVSDTANGFFLYAKVVLENLLHQGSKREFDKELDTENFPKNLEDAYGRVVARVLDHGSQSERTAALKVLTWMTCAARPLFWREIQSLFCINANDEICDPDSWQESSYKALCGSLVEEDTPELAEGEVRETVVRLVHNTAGRYLVHIGRINLMKAHEDMALFCSEYLASQPFQDVPQTQTIRESAVTGYYGFLEYAIQSWTHHLEFIAKDPSSLQACTVSKLASSTARIFGSYDFKDQSTRDDLTTQSPDEILSVLLRNCKNNPFESRISTIRSITESIHASELDDNADSIFLRLSGALCFKCPKQNCHNFTIGFASCKNRDNHVTDHERPFRCSNGSCLGARIGFRSQSALQSHVRQFHRTSEPTALFLQKKSIKPRTIFEACTRGDLEQVQAFLDQGVDVNAPSKPQGHLTPLVVAAKHQRYQICQFLIEKGAKQLFLPERQSALRCAINALDHGLAWQIIGAASDEMKAQFLESGAFVSTTQRTMYDWVHPDGQMLQALLSMYSPTSAEVATAGADAGTLLYSLVQISDSVSKFGVILNWALSESHFRGQALSETDATRPEHNSTAEKRYALLTRKHQSNDSLLHAASREKRQSIVRHLLHQLKQQDVIATNDDGNTALHVLAVTHNRDEGRAGSIARLLIEAENDAAANLENKRGYLPIHLACERGNERVVAILAGHTHDLDLNYPGGDTVLMRAVTQRMPKVVEALLDTKRVDVCRQNRDAKTAADMALQQKDTDILKLLHAYHHASVPQKGPMELFGKDPFEYCIKSREWEFLANIEKFLDPEMGNAWSGLTQPDHITAENVYQLLSFGCILTAKLFLSSAKLFCSGNELFNLWELAKGEEDDEVRALVLLQGEMPQDIWDNQLTMVKKLLQQDSSAPALLRLLETDWYAHRVLMGQAEAQDDEELMGLLPPPPTK